ncbi:cob(I)yrinic acid a,c-diamide adenosyltransferase [Roseibium denhamense]|uniref:Corrinoid adenosyltransferase n=1 Tax=Roseibium denhamense TaxID=76305 RepID=A0ABY1PC70_9HYPH|nr:cob(I)yrinic acid a,c-diamide adenosyltransferase [Roseibium denhamense]MTI05312.1 cob(I)yrinic acid a,c-diamide adenosyltransferase [Roseibium denhamense]SMP30409.1 ATP:cob(I)alamin adenosyltransferase [Roseibium denhamense]
MVVLNKIYTKTGDDGTTALGSGERRPKHDLRIEAYGTVDETNSIVGIVRLQTAENAPLVDGVLGRIQNDLFDLGADLATPETGQDLGYEPLRVTDGQVEAIEAAIDELNADLSPLRSFVLPGGSAASAHLHLARTVSRRAERLIVELSQRENINPAASRYMNRLSDYFFVASRYLNNKGEDDVLWVPGKNR